MPIETHPSHAKPSPDAKLIDLCTELIAVAKDNDAPWPGDASDPRGDDWHNRNLDIMDQLAAAISTLPARSPAGLVARARCLSAAGDALGDHDRAEMVAALLQDVVAVLGTETDATTDQHEHN